MPSDDGPLPEKVKQWLLQVETRFRETHFYFSLSHAVESKQIHLTVSTLAPLASLLERKLESFETMPYWIFFFGPNVDLHPDFLADLKMDFSLLNYQQHTLVVCRPDTSGKKSLAKRLRNYADLWLLMLPFSPSAEDLQAMGIWAKASAFQENHLDLRGGSLINFFPDPSFSGTMPTDIAALIQVLFDQAWEKHWGGCHLSPTHPAVLARQALRPIAHLELQSVLGSLTASKDRQLVHFTIKGLHHPVIFKSLWPRSQEVQITWDEDHWSNIHEKKRTILKTLWDLIASYFWPVMLTPVAIMVIPLTLFLWPFYYFSKRKRLGKKLEGGGEIEDDL